MKATANAGHELVSKSVFFELILLSGCSDVANLSKHHADDSNISFFYIKEKLFMYLKGENI